MNVFVSYSRVDRTFINRFVVRLRRMFPQDSIWYDEDLHGGDLWWEEILNQIVACDVFIYLLSNESVTSPYCQAEFAEARRLQKRIITVQVRDRTQLTAELGDIQYVDMKTGVDDSKSVEDIVRAISYQRDRIPIRPLRALWTPRTARPSTHSEMPREDQRDVDTPTLKAMPIPETSGSQPISSAVFYLRAAAIIIVLGIVGAWIVSMIAARIGSNNPTPTLSLTETKAANNPMVLPSAIPTNTLTLDFAAAAQTFDALSTAAIKVTNLAATQGFHNAQTATAYLWTRTPTLTLTLTPNITASFEVFLTQRAALNLTVTATRWTRTPTATPSLTFTPEPIALTPVTQNILWQPIEHEFDGVVMVLVPVGCFEMGSNKGENDEKPVTQICFEKPFWIDKYEVTQSQFKKFGGRSENNPSFKGDDLPIQEIKWIEAQNFCANRGGHLPTEAEWEYAARGPDNLAYPWGNDFYDRNIRLGELTNVGSNQFNVSWVGAFDMSGNVWEWTSTIYKPYPYTVADGRENTLDTANPRVIRGGSWFSGRDSVRASYRFSYDPYDASTYYYHGFRCIRL